ncbi:MAG: hypothetical protein M9932_02135 [Xanthobacteraceae bacterium]|nr:hypothetical protein [Xanthobacteraceae bacterium]
MLKAALIVMFGLAATAPAVAQSHARSSGTSSSTSRNMPAKPPARAMNSCAAFGPGFVKLEGSDTCVRIGGSISVGVGGGSGVRGAPR